MTPRSLGLATTYEVLRRSGATAGQLARWRNYTPTKADAAIEKAIDDVTRERIEAAAKEPPSGIEGEYVSSPMRLANADGWTPGSGSPIGDDEVTAVQAWNAPSVAEQLRAVVADAESTPEDRATAAWLLLQFDERRSA